MNFFKKRNFSFWIIILLFIVAIFLYAMGFKITYSPLLENSWAAIDAVGGWVSALSAMMAVAVAVVVANRQDKIARKQNEIATQQAEIAEQQNRIALFEQRFEFFNMVQTCITIGSLLPFAKDAEAAVSLVAESFDKGNYISHIENDKNADFIKAIAIDAYDRAYEIMQMGEFLFDFKPSEYMLPLMNSLLEIVTLNGSEREKRYHRFAFTQQADKIEKELMPHIIESLSQLKR